MKEWILIAATNRPEVLDRRCCATAGSTARWWLRIRNVGGREQILKVHSPQGAAAPDVNLRSSPRGTPGFSGADLMNLVNEGRNNGGAAQQRMVPQSEFEEAKDKVMYGRRE